MISAEEIKKEVLKQLELYLEKMLQDEKMDLLLNSLKVQLEAAIPGQIDNLILEAVFPKLMPIMKAEILKLVESISKEV